MNIPTPHIEAKKGDFAKTVLMPGDPLRARFIAEHYLEDAVLVNSVRQMSGYTGTYKGKRVSVMASGMGMPLAFLPSRQLLHLFCNFSKDVSLLSDNLWYYLPRFFIKSTILQHYFSIPNIA